MIYVNDNCHSSTELVLDRTKVTYPSYTKAIDVKESIRVTLADYFSEGNRKILPLFTDDEKNDYKNALNELVIETTRRDGKCYVETGNYLGKFHYQEMDINIQSRFSDALIKRMLNFANDIYLGDVDTFSDKSKTEDFTKFILYYLFVQSLEKAYLLGLPKGYQSVNHHEMRVKGRFDIQRHIKQDIPFLGKISSVSREMCDVQEIIDVLYKAVSLIENDSKQLTNNISHIKQHLIEHRSRKFVSKNIIEAAKSSNALKSPIYSQYKKVLRYAEYIIQLNSTQETENLNADLNFSFLINVAELFEIYISKLLQQAFPEWSVESPKIELYNSKFYERKIIPDIVMERGNDVLVFDTKYKTMKFQGRNKYGMGDLDRSDFFQINTYMSYYEQQNKNLICGGLLYPLSEVFDEQKCHALHWLSPDRDRTKFIVDGLELLGNGDNYIKAEEAFINRIKQYMKESL